MQVDHDRSPGRDEIRLQDRVDRDRSLSREQAAGTRRVEKKFPSTDIHRSGN